MIGGIVHHLIFEKDKPSIIRVEPKRILCDICNGRCERGMAGNHSKTCTKSVDDLRIKNLKVPVVFTGAMIPMGFEDSDATQNVTEALLSAKLLSPGFYISFHNQIFSVPHVQKNKDKI